MKHYFNKTMFILGMGFIFGAGGFTAFELVAWLKGAPVESIDVAYGAAFCGLVAAWQA